MGSARCFVNLRYLLCPRLQPRSRSRTEHRKVHIAAGSRGPVMLALMPMTRLLTDRAVPIDTSVMPVKGAPLWSKEVILVLFPVDSHDL